MAADSERALLACDKKQEAVSWVVACGRRAWRRRSESERGRRPGGAGEWIGARVAG
jgi:hypothetical protein